MTEWTIKEFLPRGELSIIKWEPVIEMDHSVVVVDIALSVASGHPYQDKAVRQGVVFYMVGRPQGDMESRFEAWTLKTNVPNRGLPLLLSERPVDLTDFETTASVAEELDTRLKEANQELELVIVDSYERHIGTGNAGDELAWKVFMHNVDRIREPYGATAVVVTQD